MPDWEGLKQDIQSWGRELGFQQIGIAPTQLEQAEARLQTWLAQGCHGSMDYMARHGLKRSRPALLHEGTLSIICARMDYLPEDMEQAWQVLKQAERGYVSRYALGRDYHKLLRRRLDKLARRIQEKIPLRYRVFTDSAPVLEKPLAENAGLGWIGKHTNLINQEAGSWFFLGEIYSDLPLPPDPPAAPHCGTCQACMEVCPTRAITAPYQLDARLCISYLTIELHGPIPEALRSLLGNRIYGCDDCQLVCPWNRFAKLSAEQDFLPRHALENSKLVELFAWEEQEFLKHTEGSAVRRLGHERWLRNIATALGNAPPSPEITAALQTRAGHPSPVVREHVRWALESGS